MKILRINKRLATHSQRRQCQPTPVLLPGKSHGRRSLVGCSPWGPEESDTTERLQFHFLLSCTGEGNGNPLPVFLPGESQGRGSLVGFCLWGHTESDTTEMTSQQQQQQPTPVFLPGESHGGRSMVGYSPWGCKESDTTERLHFHFLEIIASNNQYKDSEFKSIQNS